LLLHSLKSFIAQKINAPLIARHQTEMWSKKWRRLQMPALQNGPPENRSPVHRWLAPLKHTHYRSDPTTFSFDKSTTFSRIHPDQIWCPAAGPKTDFTDGLYTISPDYSGYHQFPDLQKKTVSARRKFARPQYRSHPPALVCFFKLFGKKI
jgi:hypothetical protein